MNKKNRNGTYGAEIYNRVMVMSDWVTTLNWVVGPGGEGILTRKRSWCRGPEVNRRLAYSSSRGGGEEDDVVMLERKVKAESCKVL